MLCLICLMVLNDCSNISLLMLNRRWCSVNMFWCVYIHLFSFFMLHLCCKGLEMFKITCQQVSRKNWFYPLVSREMYSLIIRLDHFLYNPLPVKFVSWIDIINREWEVIIFVQTFISFAFRQLGIRKFYLKQYQDHANYTMVKLSI